MTEPRAWPNSAKDSRDRCAELAVDGIRALRVVVLDLRPMNETERLRRESTALSALQEILRKLEQMGAPVREL